VEPIYWLLLFILLLVVEFLTVGLTTIWFAGGAVVAMVVNMLGGNIWIQMIVFLAASLLLLIFTRPFAVRYINRGRVDTNIDKLIGAEAVVTESINNLESTGKVQVNGLEWTARSKEADALIENGTTVEILSIEGVKLIVKEKEA
jgi:membrane protein implicated in regulation of membrane protease activity